MSFGENIGKAAGGAASGAAIGATIGSIIPGVGTVIGGAIGGLGGLIFGGASGAETDSLKDNAGNRKYKDLSWYEKAALNIDNKISGIGHWITGDDEETDSGKLINRLKKNDKGMSADAVTSLNTGGQINGEESKTKLPQGNQSQGGSMSQNSLGRPSAVDSESSLEGTNYNNNNFSF